MQGVLKRMSSGSNGGKSIIINNDKNINPNQNQNQNQQLKCAALAQANSQSLGIYKLNEKETNYGNFLIPILPPPQNFNI